MKTMNSYQASGYITGKPELKATTNGTVMIKLTLRVIEFRRKGETWEDYANFIDCVMFGNRAEKVFPFLADKRYISIEGALHQNRWETEDGQKRSKLEVHLSDIYLPPHNQQNTQQPPQEVYDDDVPF